jgi:hypothetical protein
MGALRRIGDERAALVVGVLEQGCCVTTSLSRRRSDVATQLLYGCTGVVT